MKLLWILYSDNIHQKPGGRYGMKKYGIILLMLLCIFGLFGCNSKSMNYIIENEPEYRGHCSGGLRTIHFN